MSCNRLRLAIQLSSTKKHTGSGSHPTVKPTYWSIVCYSTMLAAIHVGQANHRQSSIFPRRSLRRAMIRVGNFPSFFHCLLIFLLLSADDAAHTNTMRTGFISANLPMAHQTLSVSCVRRMCFPLIVKMLVRCGMQCPIIFLM